MKARNRRPSSLVVGLNDAYGFVQWNDQRSELYVEQVGDAPANLTVSLVDRGAI